MLKKGAQLDGFVGLALLESDRDAPRAVGLVAVAVGGDDVDVGGAGDDRLDGGVGRQGGKRQGRRSRRSPAPRPCPAWRSCGRCATASAHAPGGCCCTLPCQRMRYARSSGWPARGQLGGHPVGDDVVVGLVDGVELHQLDAARAPVAHRRDPGARAQLVARLVVLVARVRAVALHQAEALERRHRERGRQDALGVAQRAPQPFAGARLAPSGRRSRAPRGGSRRAAAGSRPRRTCW